MIALGIIVPVAILAALVIAAVLFIQRGAAGVFWAVRWYARRRLETPDERTGLLRRGYFILGVGIFGVASIVLLPMAVYNALRWLLIPVTQFEYRPGAGDSLAAALVVVPV